MSRDLGILKLRVGWGIRARRYKEKIQLGRAGKITRERLQEKKQYK